MTKGTFCISIDSELLWGRKNSKNINSFALLVRKERAIIQKLILLFRKYSIPATWAIVGRILEHPVKKSKDDDLWYGQDIVKTIAKENIHELACHSHSHPIFTEISRKQADQEIKHSLKIAKKFGYNFQSFVFPKNKIKHLDLLKTHGFKCFRGPDKRPWELLFPGIPPAHTPAQENDLINIPGSLYFVSARGLRRYIPLWLRALKIKLGINRAIRTKKVFHLWFHPIDFAESQEKLLFVLNNVLKYAQVQKKKGKLDIMTMGQIAKK